MKKLEIKQMEKIQGGGRGERVIECGFASAGLILAFTRLAAATGGVGLYVVAASFVVAPTSWGLSCFR